MLVRPAKRYVAAICSLLAVLYFSFNFYYTSNEVKVAHGYTSEQSPKYDTTPQRLDYAESGDSDVNAIYAESDDENGGTLNLDYNPNNNDLSKTRPSHGDLVVPELEEEEDFGSPLPDGLDYREIFSLSTRDRRYIPVYTGNKRMYNPAVIPHPSEHDLWIIVAQLETTGQITWESELVMCKAGMLEGVMVCTADPEVLPVEPSIIGKCEGDHAYANSRPGPRDARIFHGPDAPFILYGSQSSYTCLGIWLQDFRMLIEEYALEQGILTKFYEKATEVQRPAPVKEFEKNFFLFWDSQGLTYVHHDIYPHRVFAKLDIDGSVGPDLAPLASKNDDVCLAMYMPTLAPENENIHQATNSLSITLCKRSDPTCFVTEENTFTMTIFQHKSYHSYHCIYEPYVMLFQQNSPFAIHAISQRPLWIHGRALLTKDSHSIMYESDPNAEIPEGHSELFYITSMSWKTHGQKYHGYIDDPIYLSFGIEDTRPGLMDILAGDLLQDLGYCHET